MVTAPASPPPETPALRCPLQCPPRFGPPPYDDPPIPMPWTWKRTDDRTGVNVYDHTDAEEPVLTLPTARSRGVTTRDGIPASPDVRTAIFDYLADHSGAGYVQRAALDIALWGVREREAAETPETRTGGPPTDTPAAETARAYDRARQAADGDADGDGEAIPPGATGTLVVGDRADSRDPADEAADEAADE